MSLLLRLALLLPLTLGAGCAQEPPSPGPRQVHVAHEPFVVGEPEHYRSAGVYGGYRTSRGIWLVSDGRMLVALAAACPVEGGATRFDDTIRQFRCVSCASRFSDGGLPRGNSRAKMALVRCRIEYLDDGRLQVDPTHRFRQERNQWSHPLSLYLFASG